MLDTTKFQTELWTFDQAFYMAIGYDEPTGSLDENNSDTVMNILHELNDPGKTVIVVTHSGKIVAKEKFVVKLPG